jgi:hypothetical protein
VSHIQNLINRQGRQERQGKTKLEISIRKYKSPENSCLPLFLSMLFDLLGVLGGLGGSIKIRTPGHAV